MTHGTGNRLASPGPQWTASQWQAITHRGSATLVCAAAGSGKTAVLIQRILERLCDPADPVEVDQLLVVTFTKAAAAEMRQRLADRLTRAIGQPDSGLDRNRLARQLSLLERAQISTLHSVCLGLVRQHFHLLELDPGFSELGEHEARLLQREVVEDLFEQRYAQEEGLGEFLDLVDRFGGKRGDDDLRDLVLYLYDATSSLLDPLAWLAESAQRFAVPHDAQLADLSLAEPLLVGARESLAGAARCLGQAIALAQRDLGLGRLCERLERERQATVRAASQTDLAAMREALWAIDLGPLPRTKDADSDPERKKQVVALWDEAKRAIGRWLKPASLDSWLGSRDREAAALEELRALHGAMETLTGLVATFDAAYAAAKKERAVIDFADQERLTLQLLQGPAGRGASDPSDIAMRLQAGLREVLVDEYQDINPVQDAIIRLLCTPGPAGEPANLFMVGDPKQSIYRFRHADPDLFLSRYRTYGVDSRGPRRIDLATNFRSRREVLEGANFLFRQILTEDLGKLPYDDSAALVYGASYPQQGQAAPVEVHLCWTGLEHGEAGDDPDRESVEDDGEEAFETLEPQVVARAREREAAMVSARIGELLGRSGNPPLQVSEPETGKLRALRPKDVVI
ncbi:MAG: UvrD-helicase domain-containing protein, partial [Cyanobacteria bacterium REEB65]|nr:UvrD-helicase domain-containing protein [Cyanobacteria bacterium REEB65]